MAVVANRVNSWAKIEPYIVPGAIVAGVTLVVAQLWGNIAATCFLAVSIGVGLGFPRIITAITKGNFYVSVAQTAVIAALPLLGAPGIIGAAALSSVLLISKDVRIYQLRSEINTIKQKIAAHSKKLEEEIKKTKKHIEDFGKNETSINSKMKGLETVDEKIIRADKLLGEIKEKRTSLDKTLKDFEDKSEEREQATNRKKQKISDLKKTVAETKTRVERYIAQIEPLLAQVHEALNRR